MTTPNRATLISKSFKVLKKHYKPTSAPNGRPVLEHLLYAVCLENSPYPAADTAFQKIYENAFDWNEVRVTTVSEISESMAGIPDPKRSAANLKRLLQSVFEAQYSYDLEHLRKQNLGKAIKSLEKFSGATKFAIGYLTQHGLGGHSIPLDRGALDVMYITGVINEKEREKQTVPGLERAIPKAKGIEYGSLLHQLAADFVATPFSPKVRAILLEINADAKERFPKRPTRKTTKKKEPVAKKDTKAAATAGTKKKSPSKAPAAKKSSRTKKASTSKARTTKTKKLATKQLTKRKPK